ncbi:MAG: DUF2145 domain-containing protein [Burkholderiales bacterium]|nr:DUF2145 domain-containing protein [Burkholderiales bacterium]
MPGFGFGLALALVASLAAASASAAALASSGAGGNGSSHTSSRYCDAESRLELRHKDRLLRLSALIRAELERSDAELAIVSRTGLDLGRWGIRHSHAGVSVRSGADTPWSVRQLYYDCDEGLPRIYDQGLSAFLFGADQPTLGHVSVVLLPPAGATALRRAALDNRLALALLAGRYSANAYAFSTRYQNCNQWLAELLAAGWGGIAPGPDARALAQRWLAERRYEPTPVEVGWRLVMWAGPVFVPWIHNDDHPDEDLAAARYRISLPAAVEGLVRAQVPQAERIQFCYTPRHVLVRRGWGAELPESCAVEAGDERVALD